MLGAQGWDGTTSQYRQSVWHFSALQPTLGWQSNAGEANTSTTWYPVTASSFITNSAADTKSDIKDLSHDLDTLLKLRPVSYRPITHTTLAKPHSRGTAKRVKNRTHGLVAEEVEKHLPEVIAYLDNGKPVGIDYGALVPLLIKSVQTLAQRVSDLEFELSPKPPG